MRLNMLFFSLRHLLLSFLPLCWNCTLVAHAQPSPVLWGPTLQISNTRFGAFVPRLAVVGDTVHLVYNAGATYYRRSTSGGIMWNDETEIIPNDSGPTQTTLTAFRNNVYTAWKNAMNWLAPVNIRRSTDAGTTWLDPQSVIHTVLIPERYQAPKVAAYDSMVYVIANRPTGTQQWFLTRSTDYGNTWDSVRQITFSQYGTSFGALASICATPRHVHLTFERSILPSGREIVYTRSTNQGLAWDSLTVLSAIDPYQAWEPIVAADNTGDVYVIWQDAKYGSIGGFAGTLLLRKSTDHGLTWLPEVRVSPLASAERSSVAIDRNNVHVVWDDERNGGVNRTVQYRGSMDAGLTWCEEEVIGDTLEVVTGANIASWSGAVHTSYSSYVRNGGDPAYIYYRRGDVVTSIVQPHNRDWSGTLALEHPFPNPFNSETTISITPKERTWLTLGVYDLLGRRVATLATGEHEARHYEVTWNATGASTGMYYVLLETAGGREVRTILVLR